MSTEYIDIEGMDKVEKWLEDYPKQMKSLLRRALKKAAKPEEQRANQAMPYGSWLLEVRAKTQIKSKKEELLLSSGFFGKKRNSDGSIPAWFKAYWDNYGTLQGRDPDHQFKNPIKHSSTTAASKRKNQSGQQHTNFFEKAMAGAEERIAAEMMDTVLNSIAKAEKELNNG